MANSTNNAASDIASAAAASFASDESRWQAVMDRNRAADACFYYSVSSTGIYCRPSCAARLARREHVRFHASSSAAEAAGFRPCKRCKPDCPPLYEQQRDLMTAACRWLEDAAEAPSLDELAQAAGLSRYHFQRLFKAAVGVTPKAYASIQRAQRLRTQLASGVAVTDALYAAGFNSTGHFYANSTQQLGMTPSEFRAGGNSTPIRFGIGESSLGAILVAATAKGVCAILLGADAETLLRDLQDRFVGAQLVGGDAAFEQWMAQVIGLVETPASGLDLPLDIRGTAFQQRVWQALRAIPPGSTASYSEIAAQLGLPKAARAVAQACAANAIAIAIPCHRVVRNDGALSGYRWGVERKRLLLEREGAL
ncbi:MAG TPA: bifunctional DNA-binding transcriptional regulator/O6-methylguanine-DNA methyltransferase Ada [Spongiibacteraceae bacterium]|nr:bifunctional DNA-binding transcriptional regulator/O6-methylguanine-DNA methyltransferase Ada [Spongiibacteraceae bacterium]